MFVLLDIHLLLSKALGNIVKRGVSMYVFSDPERTMLKIEAKEDLKLHTFPPPIFDATNRKTMLYALSGDCN